MGRILQEPCNFPFLLLVFCMAYDFTFMGRWETKVSAKSNAVLDRFNSTHCLGIFIHTHVGEHQRFVRSNQDAILCTNCNKWSHAKCLPMSRPIFQYYLDKPNIEWCCPTCALPPLSDSFFAQDSEGEVLSSIMEVNSSECENEKLQENTAELPSCLKMRKSSLKMPSLNS